MTEASAQPDPDDLTDVAEPDAPAQVDETEPGPLTRADQASEMIRKCYESGEAKINGRVYTFMKTKHPKRRKVFAVFTSIQDRMTQGDFSFITEQSFQDIEAIMYDLIMYDGNLLSRLDSHWDTYPEDYITLICTAMGVITYPFLRGVTIA